MKGQRAKRGRPEDDEARFHVIPLYAGAGFDCYVNSTRVNPVGVTPGIADLEIFAAVYGFRFVHEVKIGTTRQSQAQKLYQERCDATGTAYVLGDVTAAEDFLVWIGRAVWWPRGQLMKSPMPDPESVRKLPHEHRVFQFEIGPRADQLRRVTPVTWRDRMIVWQDTDVAREQRERWGWKPTPTALRKAVR